MKQHRLIALFLLIVMVLSLCPFSSAVLEESDIALASDNSLYSDAEEISDETFSENLVDEDVFSLDVESNTSFDDLTEDEYRNWKKGLHTKSVFAADENVSIQAANKYIIIKNNYIEACINDEGIFPKFP